jgi:hypothetical protein
VNEVERPAEGQDGPRTWRPSFDRRILLVGTIVVLLGGGATAVAVDQDLFNKPPAPEALSSPSTIASGATWSVKAWKSVKGICLGVIVENAQRAEGCGFPVVGASPPTSAESSQTADEISGMYARGAGDGELYVAGVAAESVARAEVELRDGSVADAPIVDGPSSLAVSLRFFVLRIRDTFSNPFPVAAYRAYGSSGELLERVPVVRPQGSTGAAAGNQ